MFLCDMIDVWKYAVIIRKISVIPKDSVVRKLRKQNAKP